MASAARCIARCIALQFRLIPVCTVAAHRAVLVYHLQILSSRSGHIQRPTDHLQGSQEEGPKGISFRFKEQIRSVTALVRAGQASVVEPMPFAQRRSLAAATQPVRAGQVTQTAMEPRKRRPAAIRSQRRHGSGWPRKPTTRVSRREASAGIPGG